MDEMRHSLRKYGVELSLEQASQMFKVAGLDADADTLNFEEFKKLMKEAKKFEDEERAALKKRT